MELLNGFLNIKKEKGMTSFGVCQALKKKFQTSKIGHSGTLDPNATGVMQVAIGKATKLLPLLEDHVKTYVATIQFGILTDTLDPEGTILQEEDLNNLEEQQIDEAILKLKDMKEQIPPQFSAIKINGKKMYEYARRGEIIELKPRPVEIYFVKRVSPLIKENGFYYTNIELTVSKGFYVRSFVRDLASSLNTIAIMSDLVRTKIDTFVLDNAKTIDNVTSDDLISIEDAFKNYERFEAKDYLVKLIKNGIMLDERQLKTTKPFLVYNNKRLIAIYEPIKEYQYKIVQWLGD